MESKKYLGENKDWLLTQNASETPMCTKKLSEVSMIIYEGINSDPCNLTVFGNKYMPCKRIALNSHNFESACDESDEKYSIEVVTAIKFFSEQLSLLPDITTMKFFEFIDYLYYALICSESEENAIECYKEQVSDLDDDDSSPLEITTEEAKTKFLNCANDEAGKQRAIDEFRIYIHDSEPTVLVIDGSLV